MKIRLKIIHFVCLFVCFCISCSVIKKTNSCDISQIEVIKLPHDLNVTGALVNEEMFDSFPKEFKDTNQIMKGDFKFELGERLFNYSSIDIRTKAIFKLSNGKQKIIFLDKFGKIFYQDKIYKGSVEYLEYLREDI